MAGQAQRAALLEEGSALSAGGEALRVELAAAREVSTPQSLITQFATPFCGFKTWMSTPQDLAAAREVPLLLLLSSLFIFLSLLDSRYSSEKVLEP